MSLDEEVFDASTFSKNQDRLGRMVMSAGQRLSKIIQHKTTAAAAPAAAASAGSGGRPSRTHMSSRSCSSSTAWKGFMPGMNSSAEKSSAPSARQCSVAQGLSKTWPRWLPQVAQCTSVRSMPWLRSVSASTAPEIIAWATDFNAIKWDHGDGATALVKWAFRMPFDYDPLARNDAGNQDDIVVKVHARKRAR